MPHEPFPDALEDASTDACAGGAPPLAASRAGLASVPGLHSVVHRLRSIVVMPCLGAWRGIDGISMPGGLLLHGPAGSRAAFLADALAAELGADTVVVDITTHPERLPINGRVVAAVGRIDGIDADAIAALIAWFELLDDTPQTDRPLAVATSDEPWLVERRLLRVGRLDRLVFVPPPDWEARRWRISAGGLGRGLDLSERLDELTAATVGWTGADIDRLLDLIVDALARSDHGPVLLDSLSRISPGATAWMEKARVMVNLWIERGMVDDLMGYLRRVKAA